MKEMKLKNGGVELDVTIAATMLSLEGLLAHTRVAFYDLVMKCKDASHEFTYSNSERVLKCHNLMERDGAIPADVKNIVLSAVDGDKGEMHIVDPIDRTA